MSDKENNRQSVEPKKLQTFPPTSGDVFYGYVLEECLKRSSNCVVYVCHNNSINNISQKFVIKIGIKGESIKLRKEIKNYVMLSNGRGIPKLIDNYCWSQMEENWIWTEWALIVIEKFCNTFSKTCRAYAKRTLTLDQILPIAIEQINLLQFIHSTGLIHRGVKPDNFVMSEENEVFIIDFNKSHSYLNSEGNHIGFQKDDKRPNGLPLFHSINYHNGYRRTRRDDMESLGYCWIYLLRGSLPWSDVKRYPNQYSTYVRDVGKRVNQTPVEVLCTGLHKNFETYVQMCRQLKFNEEPNYELMRQLLRKIKDTKASNNLNHN